MIKLKFDLSKHDIDVIQKMFIDIFSDEYIYSSVVRENLLNKIHIGEPLTKREVQDLKERVFNDMLVDMDLAYIDRMLSYYNRYLNDCCSFILGEEDSDYKLKEHESKELHSLSIDAHDVYECGKNFEAKYGAYIRGFLKPYYDESMRIYEEKHKNDFEEDEEDIQEERSTFPDYQHIEEQWGNPYYYNE